jgi:hypothetical protein
VEACSGEKFPRRMPDEDSISAFLDRLLAPTNHAARPKGRAASVFQGSSRNPRAVMFSRTVQVLGRRQMRDVAAQTFEAAEQFDEVVELAQENVPAKLARDNVIRNSGRTWSL